MYYQSCSCFCRTRLPGAAECPAWADMCLWYIFISWHIQRSSCKWGWMQDVCGLVRIWIWSNPSPFSAFWHMEHFLALWGFFSLGSFNASFCPHISGCRDQVIAENQIELDLSKPEVSVTVVIPDGRTLVLVCSLCKCIWFHLSFRNSCKDESPKERICLFMVCFKFLGSVSGLLLNF